MLPTDVGLAWCWIDFEGKAETLKGAASGFELLYGHTGKKKGNLTAGAKFNFNIYEGKKREVACLVSTSFIYSCSLWTTFNFQKKKKKKNHIILLSYSEIIIWHVLTIIE